jgi:hypothetical protein
VEFVAINAVVEGEFNLLGYCDWINTGINLSIGYCGGKSEGKSGLSGGNARIDVGVEGVSFIIVVFRGHCTLANSPQLFVDWLVLGGWRYDTVVEFVAVNTVIESEFEFIWKVDWVDAFINYSVSDSFSWL